MKKKLETLSRFILGFATIALFISGCSKSDDKVGLDIFPKEDLVQIFKDSTLTVSGLKAFTEIDGNQRTDEPNFNLLGTFVDPVFGTTKADFALQFRIDSFPAKHDAPVVDSLVLYMLYNELYGDTVTPQNFKVYELDQDLSKKAKYYQDVDLKALAKAKVLANISYLPQFEDSLNSKTSKVDTVIQTIRIRLDTSLADRLMAADSTTLSSNDPHPDKEKNYFLNYFKGLYIEAGDLNSGGSLMRIKTIASGSRMVLYYHTKVDSTLKITYKINSNSARVSRFEHDYSQTAFGSKLGQGSVTDTLLYIQSGGGLRTRIEIPKLDMWRDSLKSESVNFVINKAEIIFHVDTLLSDVKKLLPPSQLVFSAIGVDTLGNQIKYLPKDFEFSSVYYNGVYNSTDKTYRFNIANHLQQIIENIEGKENMGFYLAVSQPVSAFRRVVLKGPGSKDGVGLQIIYSKIK